MTKYNDFQLSDKFIRDLKNQFEVIEPLTPYESEITKYCGKREKGDYLVYKCRKKRKIIKK